MNDKEVGEALLKWDSRGQQAGLEPHEQVAVLLDRDRRHVRRLAFATIALWTLSAVGIPLFFYLHLEFVFPKVNWLMQEVITHKDGVEPAALVKELETLTAATFKLGNLWMISSVAALLLAAGSTVWLVFATRRATLREVNANLAAISEQLKRLRPTGNGV